MWLNLYGCQAVQRELNSLVLSGLSNVSSKRAKNALFVFLALLGDHVGQPDDNID